MIQLFKKVNCLSPGRRYLLKHLIQTSFGVAAGNQIRHYRKTSSHSVKIIKVQLGQHSLRIWFFISLGSHLARLGILLVRPMKKNPRPASKSQLFEAIYRQLALPVMKFLVKRLGGDQQAAEEVFSRTWAAAWEGWDSFRHKSSYFTWICRIGLNKTADYWRDQVNDNSRWIAPILKDMAIADTKQLSPEERMSLAELRAALRDCLNLLPQDKRQLLQFRFWYGWSLKQISEKLGISERAVEGRLYRAKQTLKRLLRTNHPELIGDWVKDSPET